MNSTNIALATIAVSLVASYLLTPVASKIATVYGIVAKPGGRRIHKRPTPLLGGAAMYTAFLLAMLLIVAIDKQFRADNTVLGIVISVSFVALVGVLDDRFELPGWVQALAIVVAGCVLYLFGVTIHSVTYPFKGGQVMVLGYWAIPITVIWILMVTKAVDCMDGVDGLAGGISVIISATLLLMALKAKPQSELMVSGLKLSALMSAALIGATLGFLKFNYPPAKLFMGTVGSQFLGFMLATISLVGALKIATLVGIIAPILALGVPLGDTTLVVVRRIISGRSIAQADRTHLHHRLMDRGFTSKQIIWTVYAMTFVLCVLAYLLFTGVG